MLKSICQNNMRIAWLTDIHLNFLTDKQRQRFYNKILAASTQGIFITGDVTEAPKLEDRLKEMSDVLQQPVYFVLGNHDYYRGYVAPIRKSMAQLMREDSNLHWLTGRGPVRLLNGTWVLGVDGWADGRYGDFENTSVSLNDCYFIGELREAFVQGRSDLLLKMQALAENDARLLQQQWQSIQKEEITSVMILVHIPPFQEVAVYRGKQCDQNYLPLFSSKILGETIQKIASAHPNISFTVLCGHTHGEATYQVAHNLLAKLGKASYGQPAIQEIFVFDE